MKLPIIPQYELREYEEKDFPQVQSLFSMAFGGREINIESWIWQFKNNPCKTNRITTLWDENKLVALTALTPTFCHINGYPEISACAGTSMARDDYFGVSIQLSKESALQNKDIGLIYGFPNKNATPIVKYLGHHFCGDICFWTIRPVFTNSNNNYIFKIERFNDEHGKLYEHLINNCFYIRDRNIDYLNWRFFDRPSIDYYAVEYKNEDGVLGYMIYDYYIENNEKHFQIIDIIAKTKNVFQQLILYAINTAYLNNACLVKIWMTYKDFTNPLKELGFDYGMQPFKCFCWNRDFVLEDCYFTMSDSDIF